MNRESGTELKEILLKNFERFEGKINGESIASMQTKRQQAMDTFSEIGLPGPREEEYKYTHISRILAKKFDFNRIASDTEIAVSKIKLPFKDEDITKILLLNGKLMESSSDLNNLQEGVQITSIREAFNNYPELIEKKFGHYGDLNKDAFLALNTAFTSDGLFLLVQKNTVVKRPIVVYNFVVAEEQPVIAQPRLLLVFEENTEANLVEVFQQIGNNECFLNNATEVWVNTESRINYYKLQDQTEKTYQVDNTKIRQAGKSLFNAFTFTFEGAIIRNNLSITLDDEFCESHMYGLYLTKGKSLVDNHTVVDHAKPNCFSNEIYKGIMNDESTGVFNGKIYVRPNAQKTNAFQSNKNILLTETASVNSKPQLEIWADDVKCSHGCTTGQLDDEQMFYLRSRGISQKSAKAMLLQAFASDVLENAKVNFLKDYVNNVIHQRLHD